MNKQINTRCVVTGLGMINAIGNSVDECWENALAGKTGIDVVKSVNADECYANLGAEVTCDDLDAYKGVDRASKLCLKASDEAVRDSGLDMKNEDATRVGVVMGSCVGGVVSIENYVVNGENTDDIRRMTISPIANHVANRVGAGGVITNVGNACAAGSISVAYACELIRAGVADVFIVGGADAFAAVPFAGFHALHALSENPCSPFNHSNGITLGEGAGAIVVESYEHAKKRNAKIYCDVLAAGVSSDAHHITAPRPDGIGQMYAIRTAIANSGIKPEDIDYVNAHGTGTAKNDEAEFLSLHAIFDSVNDDLSVSSTKAMVGHCLGAAGAIEAVYAIKALVEDKIPPTIGYTDEDKEALKEKAGKIDFMPNEMKEKKLDFVMSNSFAFGGSNASIIFSKGEGNVAETANDDPIYITGMGIVSPLGNGVQNYIDKVKAGETISEASVFANTSKDDYDKYDVKMAFYRKLDKLSLMQVISGLEALESAKIEIADEKAEDYGMIIGTDDGPLSTVYEFQQNITTNGTKSGSAFNFPNTVYNAAGGYLSIKTNMRGVNVTVTNGAQSGMSSLCYAYNEIRQNHAKVMLATGTDENSEVMEKLYRQLGHVSSGKASVYGGTGFAMSDGSTTVVLESGESANARGAKKYAEVAGYGMTHAVTEYGTVSGTEAGLEEAINVALKDAGITIADIDAVYGFGNGCTMVDTVEKNVYNKIFDAKTPVHNVRVYVGESRAAACALSVATAALTLSGELGSEQKAFFFGDTVTEGKADTSAYKYVLATAASEGGSYCAVILKKV